MPPLPAHLRPTVRGSGSVIRALLGPTNTGKTHRAIERMIELGAGLIGLPLRLLVREVYDRLCARVPADDVALITGEERIVPHKPRFWVCTVESMPLTLAVPFVAVDEIQLAVHPTRGHVFTDRLLNARGTRETWFMGSDMMRPIFERLVPTAQIERFERLSELRYTDPRSIHALPRRSALVAFSAAHVYELAERLRQAHGGAAVVLGALSPQARNAQVALFESGEVQHLVSTDAIGMGLNLDIRYVYFGAVRKFDGTTHRPLEPWELGQIAGRAGRYTSNGAFGLTRDCADQDGLPPQVIEAVERQTFAAVRKVRWRNSDLDLSSAEALRASLNQGPFAKCLNLAHGQSDQRALEALLKLPDVASSVRGAPDRVALLWDVCSTPDYRQRSDAAHARLLAQVYRQLTSRHARIDPDWIAGHLSRIDHTDSPIDTLIHRIASIRTFAYIAHRSDWLAQPERWRAQVLDIESRLSDALHQRLTLHFVETLGGVNVARPVPRDVRLDEATDRVVSATHTLAALQGFEVISDPDAVARFGVKATRRAARRACLPACAARAEALLDAPDSAFAFDDDLRIRGRGWPLASLEAGPTPDAPRLRLLALDLFPAESRNALQQRLDAWLRAQIERFQRPLDPDRVTFKPGTPTPSPALTGLLYSLRTHLGVVPRASVRDQLQALTADDRALMGRFKVRLGADYVFTPPQLKPRHMRLRATLLAVTHGLEALPSLPGSQVAPQVDWPPPFAQALGFPSLGPRCVRVDLVERLSATLRKATSRGPAPLPTRPTGWIGCDLPTWTAIAQALGFETRDGRVHPPARAPKRRRRKPRREGSNAQKKSAPRKK